MKSFLYNIIRYNKRRCNLSDSTNYILETDTQMTLKRNISTFHENKENKPESHKTVVSCENGPTPNILSVSRKSATSGPRARLFFFPFLGNDPGKKIAKDSLKIHRMHSSETCRA